MMVDLRSDLARVRGLGSAKDGVHHWWVQRLSAVALVPLGIWFVVSAITLAGVSLDGFRTWLNTGANVFLMILFVATLFYHLKLGLQVVIEDYVHREKAKVVSLMINTFANIFVGAFSVFALLKVAFGG
jgi:succinate dehydrogenase / fumarate reductase membrane anchor subunit